MLSSFALNLREGVEMALIVAIILAYLARTGHREQFGRIWAGVVLAILVCIAAGGAFFLIVGETGEGYMQMIIEGIAMTIAVGVLTYMVFWMRQAGANISRMLREKVDAALEGGSLWALTVLAFTSVLREGVEVVLFTVAAAQKSSPGAATLGAVLGLGVAAIFGYGVYRGSHFLNLKAFFKWTAIFLVFVAAGMLSGAIREFHELGWIPKIVSYLWDSSGILSEDSLVGGLARSLFGYDSSPSLVQVLAYVCYVALALRAFLRPIPAKAPAADASRA